jgi:hypothetical protein
VFVLNADSSAASRAELLERSKLSADSFFLVGPEGRVAADIDARYIETAHSCASAASFTLRPRKPLAPGEYTVVLLLDAAAWPSVFTSDVSTHDGKRALVRRYRRL